MIRLLTEDEAEYVRQHEHVSVYECATCGRIVDDEDEAVRHATEDHAPTLDDAVRVLVASVGRTWVGRLERASHMLNAIVDVLALDVNVDSCVWLYPSYTDEDESTYVLRPWVINRAPRSTGTPCAVLVREYGYWRTDEYITPRTRVIMADGWDEDECVCVHLPDGYYGDDA